MSKTDARIDDYIESSADFAKPILSHIREVVHKAWPEINEAIKWGCPYFVFEGPLCYFAAFKHHCSFGFWKQSLLDGSFPSAGEAMGSFGRITSLEDLPDEHTIVNLIRQAAELNIKGVTAKKRPARTRKTLEIPELLISALKRNKKAHQTFENFPYSAKKEYVEWIDEAKTEATRDKRLATTIEWLGEGKRRNWKYEKC